MKKFLALISVIFMSLNSIGQTGPGGVGNSTSVAFWVDAQSSMNISGSSVASIKDFSGSNPDFTQGTMTSQPVFMSNVYNGVSALQFNGDQFISSGANSVLNNSTYFDYYYFGKNSNLSVLGIPLAYDYDLGLTAFTGILGRIGFNSVYGHGSSYQARRTNINNSTGYGLFQGRYNVPTGTLTAYFNFSQQSQITNANSPAAGNHVAIHIGGPNVSNAFEGEISEAFAFNFVLNSCEENILKNYISAKYGVAIANDYYDYETTHQFGVIGIGRENNLSKHLNSVGNGMVRIQKSSLTDGQYLFVGHDIDDNVSLSSDVPAAFVNSSRLLKTWRMDEPTDIGNITVVFDLDSLNDFSALSSSYSLIVDSDGDGVFSTGLSTFYTGTYNAVTREVTFTGVDMDAGDYFTLLGDEPQSIFSIQSGDWNDPLSWNCGCIPTSLNDVTISLLDTIEISSFSAAKSLIVLGGLKWINSSSLDIRTDDFIVNGGAVDMTVGKLIFSSFSAQEIDLNGDTIAFYDIEMNNIGDSIKLMNGTILLNGQLSPVAGVFDFSAGDLIINSVSAVTSARVGPVTVNAELIGDATVRRFIPAGVAGNRNMASPVIGATLADWDDSLAISGLGFPDGCAFGGGVGGCYYSVKEYYFNHFQDITSITHVLQNGNGYEVFVGDDLLTFSGTTVQVKGSLNNSDVTSMNGNSWGTLGNPYASPVLFSQASTTNVMGKYFYVFDAASGSYQWYDKVSNTSSIPQLANGLIASGQGFWVKDFGFLTFPQSSKTSSNATFIRNNEVENALQLTLNQNNSTFFNVTSLAFSEEALDENDPLDIQYLSTGFEKASSLYMVYNDTVQLTKNYLNTDGQQKVVDFKMNCKTDGYYTISPSNLSDLKNYANVYIFDKALNIMIDLSKDGSYTFYASVGDMDRFTVILTNDVLSDREYIEGVESKLVSEVEIKQLGHTLEIYAENELKNATIEVSNVVGQTIMSSHTLQSANGKQYLTIGREYSGIFIAVVRVDDVVVATKKIIL